MNPQIFRHLLRFIVILVFPLHFLGCASFDPSKPNLPYAGNPYPVILTELAQKNPLLVQELGKLPELQDGISASESFAIKSFVELYNESSAAFDIVFKDMYQEGLPKVRKYCSSLQALFWIVEDGDKENKFLLKYDLQKLLNWAWYKNGFEYDGKGRWNDFEVVVDRLNSPNLVHYYMKRNFPQGLKKPRKGGNVPLPPRVMFKNKYGNCRDSSNFGKYCLKRAGYEAKIILTQKGKKGAGLNAAVEFRDIDGKEYVIDTFKTNTVISKEAYLNLFIFAGYLY